MTEAIQAEMRFYSYAYVLMSNHVHLLLETPKDPIARIMQMINFTYTQYYNKKYNKVGHLFHGRYKSYLWGSLAGLVLGIFFLGPLGIVFGPFVGAVAGELIVQKPLAQAVQSGMGTILGMAGGLVLKIVVEAGMIIWFFMAVS